MIAGFPFLAMMAGCADCPSFDHMEVFDRDRVADGVTEHSALFALQDFARWTGREGVCVSRIDLVETMPVGVAGRYWGPGEPIEVLVGAPEMENTLLHELGHAIDHEEDHVGRYPDLFPPADRDPVDYISSNTLRQETFADTVAMGVIDLDFRQVLIDECGIDSTWTDATAYVQAEIYSAREPSPALGHRLGLSRIEGPELTGLRDDASILDMVGYDGELLLLMGGRRYAGREIHDWVVPVQVERQVVRVDPSTGAVLDHIDLPPAEARFGASPAMWFASTEGRPVVVVNDTTTRMYELEPKAGTVRGMPSIHMPPFWQVPVAILDSGDRRLAFFPSHWDDLPSLHAVDLDSGEALDLEMYQEDWGMTVYVQGLWPVGGRLLMDSYHEGISWYDPKMREWDVTPVPTWWGMRDPRRLGDRYMLFHTRFDADTEMSSAAPVGIYDLEDRSWLIAEDPCTTRYDDIVVAREATLDGVLWMLDNVEEDGATVGRRLLRFELDPESTVSTRVRPAGGGSLPSK